MVVYLAFGPSQTGYRSVPDPETGNPDHRPAIDLVERVLSFLKDTFSEDISK